jgi:hypothetical protein
MRWRLRILLLLPILSSQTPLAAEELAFSRNARTFETQFLSLVEKSLAGACLTVPIIPDDLACNPANNAFTQKSSLDAELLLSNGYANLQRVQKLMKGKVDQQLVDDMFAQGNVLQIEANAEVLFKSKYFSARYVPATIKGFSVVRNEANPDVEISAVDESSFTLQTGLEVLDDLYLGVQARFVDRKYIKKRFQLVDLATTEGKDLLKPEHQVATYIEPGVTYIFTKTWKPRVSVFVANSGTISGDTEDLQTPLEVQYGIGITPPVLWGDLDLSVEYRSMQYDETPAQRIRFGMLYHFGSMYLSGGVDSNGISGGVFYGLDLINAGIVYSTTKFINEQERYFTQTVYVQLGFQI